VRNRITFLIVLAVLLVAVSVSAGPNAGKSLTRTQDPLILEGAPLAGLTGWPIAATRAFAMKNGTVSAIPFQIDEKRPDGQYALPSGPQISADDGMIDANDELVFMAMDAGDRIGRDQLPAGFTAAVELEITDPIDGGKGWVYLASYAQNPPPLSAIDYVTYNNANVVIDTLWFRMAFHPKARLSIGDLIRKPAGGGGNRDLVDRLKIRFTGSVFGVDLDRNEENFLSETLGWIDGPVRIVRRTVNRVTLWKLKSPKAFTDNVYYINAFEFPTIIELPFRSDLIVKNPKFRISTDGMCNVSGRRFYNSNNPNGVSIDGVMDAAEKSLDTGPYTWSLVTDPGGQGGWMNRLLYDTRATPVRPNLYYNDNAGVADGPEDELGECGDIGYTLDNLGQLKKDKMYLKSILYSVPGTDAKTISEFLNIIDKPLRVNVRAL